MEAVRCAVLWTGEARFQIAEWNVRVRLQREENAMGIERRRAAV